MDQRVRDILGRRVFHGIPMWSFLCSLCARLLQIMKVESWVFGCLYFPFLSLEGPGEDEEEEEGGIMPLNPPWMAFFGVSTRGRTQLRMMRLGLVSGSNATQVHIKERSRRYLARPSERLFWCFSLFAPADSKTYCVLVRMKVASSVQEPEREVCFGCFTPCIRRCPATCVSSHAFLTPGALKASALPTPSTKAFGI